MRVREFEDGTLANGGAAARNVAADLASHDFSVVELGNRQIRLLAGRGGQCPAVHPCRVRLRALPAAGQRMNVLVVEPGYLPYEKELPIKIIEKIIKQSLEEIT